MPPLRRWMEGGKDALLLQIDKINSMERLRNGNPSLGQNVLFVFFLKDNLIAKLQNI